MNKKISEYNINSLNKNLVRSVLATAISIGATNAHAIVLNFNWTGVFSIQNASGDLVVNNDAVTNSWSGYRTDVPGTFVFDDSTGVGDITIAPISLFGGILSFTNGSVTSIAGNGMVGNFIYDYLGDTGNNMDVVWDATGFNEALAIPGFSTPGSVISGGIALVGGVAFPINSALPVTDGVIAGKSTLPIGPTPIAMTSFNLPSGGIVPIIDGTGIGGSPQLSGPLTTFSFNLDIGNANSLELISVAPSPVPVPAAIWLFGTGLAGLAVFCRRGKYTFNRLLDL